METLKQKQAKTLGIVVIEWWPMTRIRHHLGLLLFGPRSSSSCRPVAEDCDTGPPPLIHLLGQHRDVAFDLVDHRRRVDLARLLIVDAGQVNEPRARLGWPPGRCRVLPGPAGS
jgi:hypothetical protein